MMMSALPPDIREIPEGMEATRFVLPIRNLGGVRWPVGGAATGFGLAVTAFMVFWMWGPLSGGLRQAGGVGWFQVGFGLMGLPGLLAGLGLLALGLGILSNRSHAEILVTPERVSALERLGPLHWSWTRPAGGVRRVVLQKGLGTTRTNSGPERPLGAHLGLLLIESANARPLWAAVGYSPETLRSLADVLARRLSAAVESGGFDAARERVDVVERDVLGTTPGEADDVPRPVTTDIVVETPPGGLAVDVPARGLWKGSQGLFGFAILWNGFVLLMSGFVLAAALREGRVGQSWPFLLFLLVFLGIGIALLAASIHVGRRRVLLAVAGEALAVRCIGPFRTTERRFSRSDISGIGVGPSGMEVNDRPLYEVQIHLRGGRPAKVGLLSHRTREEQDWIACRLRRALGVGRA